MESSELAPTPFTAEQVRDATLPGRTYRYRVEEKGKPPVVRAMQFVEVDDEGAMLAVHVFDEAGIEIAAPPAQRVTWEELRKHAEFPKHAVTKSEKDVTVPAGTFSCAVYRVEQEDGEVTLFHFAKDLPGAPVLFVTEQNGEVISTSTLIEHRRGQ